MGEKNKSRKDIEQHEPGATKDEVMAALGKVATFEDKKESEGPKQTDR